jgi:lactoylglutathione lyase
MKKYIFFTKHKAIDVFFIFLRCNNDIYNILIMDIKGKFDHYNFNVLNLERSMAFYEKSLCLTEYKRQVADDGSFIIVFLCDRYNSGFKKSVFWLETTPIIHKTGA